MDLLNDITLFSGFLAAIFILFAFFVVIYLIKYIHMWIFGVTDILKELREIKSKLK